MILQKDFLTHQLYDICLAAEQLQISPADLTGLQSPDLSVSSASQLISSVIYAMTYRSQIYE